MLTVYFLVQPELMYLPVELNNKENQTDYAATINRNWPDSETYLTRPFTNFPVCIYASLGNHSQIIT